MRKAAALFFVLISLTLTLSSSLAAQPPHGAPLGEIAASLPPLEQTEGAVELPLAGTTPWTWRPVRDGVSISSEGGSLAVEYQVQQGQPAGAALLIPPALSRTSTTSRSPYAATGTPNSR